MTTLEDRPNSALLIVDVQVGVVEGAYERDIVVANIGSLVRKARRDGAPVVWVRDRAGVPGKRRLADRPGARCGRRRAAHRQGLRRRLRGDVPRVGPVGPRGRAALRRRREHRCVRPLDDPWRVRPGLRHDPRQRRPHDRRQDGAAGAPPPDQVIAHTNMYWTCQKAPGRTAGTVDDRRTSTSAAARA